MSRDGGGGYSWQHGRGRYVAAGDVVSLLTPSSDDAGADDAQGLAAPPKKRVKRDDGPKDRGYDTPAFFLTRTQNDRLSNDLKRSVTELVLPDCDLMVQVNFMIDARWLFSQLDPHRRTPLRTVLVAGHAIHSDAVVFPNVQLFEPKCAPYGVHHSKLMLLFYRHRGMRVVVHTANMIREDWDYKTNAMYVRDFPVRPYPRTSLQTDPFGEQLAAYVESTAASIPKDAGKQALRDCARRIREHDYSSAGVQLVASVPGKRFGDDAVKYGLLRMQKLVEHLSADSAPADFSLVAQFSSIGNVGEDWLRNQFLRCMTGTLKSKALGERRREKHGAVGSDSNIEPRLKLVWPTNAQVRGSVEGAAGGGSLPGKLANLSKLHVRSRLCQWDAALSRRARNIPHIKTYVLMHSGKIRYFLLTSANLSMSAWGNGVKYVPSTAPGRKSNVGAEINIASFELGVLFTPGHYVSSSFDLAHDSASVPLETSPYTDLCLWWDSRCQEAQEVDAQMRPVYLPVPHKLDVQPYTASDEPWAIDQSDQAVPRSTHFQSR
ncbi:Tyrosyl-DNA phosphodiesterase 1 [Porphyridium purpureum]|uniref:Tyrosyl-DNA phosphodiesterase 1 n=1 Tax=Porphyridium purpureum TaxID=35688 RepID=A0A5J4YQ97_PORPP|nr:Tyrosyl-DNA phosphodiesterase 1 [Porphyridium purpureum]|eukprot:POR7325..scf296_7